MEKSRRIYEEFWSCNGISVEVEHNGFKGGDAGHGGYVYIKICDLASTSMEINGFKQDLELVLRGDTERETFVDALEFILKELKEHQYD